MGGYWVTLCRPCSVGLLERLAGMGDQAQVDEKTDAAVHWTNILYPLANAICFPNSYPLDSDLSSGL